MRGRQFAVLSFVGLAASASVVAGPLTASQDAMKAHISFLADDLLEGREPGKPGYDIAANYVAAQFAQYGLTPKGDKGGYLQRFTLRSATPALNSSSLQLKSGAGIEPFAPEVFMLGHRASEVGQADFAPLVFVGYGIIDKQLKIDDYANVDVKGKIAVMLKGYPGQLPSEAGAHLSSRTEKRKTALAHGAIGVVDLWTPAAEKPAPFTKYKQYEYFPAMTWLDSAGQPYNNFPSMLPDVALSLDGAKKLFARADQNLDEIYAKAAANKPLPHTELKVALKLDQSVSRSDLVSSNIVGMVPGSDPQLRDEIVVFSAHLDHLGKQADGKVYNGALDNASGVATLLEMARLFSESSVKPKRSVLFVVVTGEERGLLGSSYFANHPTVPVQAMVANVNLDMPILTYDFSSVTAFGAEHSSLKDNVANAAQRFGIKVLPDPFPEETIFVRSDHYSFVREGVPSVMFATGMSSFNKGEDAGKAWGEFLEHHYHKPGDNLEQPINYQAAARFVDLNYAMALDIANAKDKPSWNKDDYFGILFKK